MAGTWLEDPETPLTYRNVPVYRIGPGGRFDLDSRKGSGGIAYTLSAEAGVLTPSRGASTKNGPVAALTTAGSSGEPVHFVKFSAPVSVMNSCKDQGPRSRLQSAQRGSVVVIEEGGREALDLVEGADRFCERIGAVHGVEQAKRAPRLARLAEGRLLGLEDGFPVVLPYEAVRRL